MVESIFISGLFAMNLFLTIGGYVLQRDRYWRRIWIDQGMPKINSIKELERYMKND